MKLSISLALLGITLGQYIIYAQASPVSNHNINELNSVDQDSNEAVPSSEIMPGRFLSDKEAENIVYLTYAEALDRKERKYRPKRFIEEPRQERSLRNYIRRRQERIRLRNERRKLRLQKQRLQQGALLQDLTRQNEITRQRLQMLNLNIQQQAALNTQKIRTQPQQIQVTTKSPQTAQVPLATASTIDVVKPVLTPQQVPIPFGKK